MKTQYALTLFAACFFSLHLVPQTLAKPPDMAFDLFYTGLRDLAGKIEAGGVPNEADLKLTDQALASKDDLSVAMALVCLREVGIATASAKVKSLDLEKQKIGSLSSAVMALIHEEAAMATLPLKDKIEKLDALTYSKQSCLNIEAVKRLAQYDITKAKAALQRIASDKTDEALSAEILLRKIAQKQGEPFTPRLADYENNYSDLEYFTGHLGESKWLNKIKPTGDEKSTVQTKELPSQADKSALNRPATLGSAEAGYSSPPN